jgi:hypothetical protein
MTAMLMSRHTPAWQAQWHATVRYRVVRHSRSATSIAHTTADRVNFPGTTQHRSSR